MMVSLNIVASDEIIEGHAFSRKQDGYRNRSVRRKQRGSREQASNCIAVPSINFAKSLALAAVEEALASARERVG